MSESETPSWDFFETEGRYDGPSTLRIAIHKELPRSALIEWCKLEWLVFEILEIRP